MQESDTTSPRVYEVVRDADDTIEFVISEARCGVPCTKQQMWRASYGWRLVFLRSVVRWLRHHHPPCYN